MTENAVAASSTDYSGIGERARHLFEMSRPIWWIHMLLPITFAILYAVDSASQILSVTSLWFLAYFSLPGNLYVYGMNDAFDVDTDQVNPRKIDDETPSVIYEHDTINTAVILICGLLMASVVFVTTDPVVLGLLAILGVAAIVYNVPPIRLKAVPFVDAFITSTLLIPPIAVYTAISGSLPPLTIIAGAWVWGMGYHIIGAIEDIEPDRKAGLLTTATFLGREKTLAFFLGLWVLAPVLIALESIPGAALMSVFTVSLIYTLVSDKELKDLYLAIPFINVGVFGVVIIGGVLRHL
ncbi:prenyltransferase (plasmid) [Haloferax larsenii]|uniref:Prenyltransferase n=1 Tax=Haloferax larsenii TaxID=302484 RepID=A0ABY5RIV5_HALLR|nr:prenyltransferase [Haloferax larsenii]UVE52089.1 prenyltransferase [Haloferax larsenii]